MKRLLIVVDMQNDFIDGSLGTKEAKEIVPNVVRKIEAYKAQGDDVVFTMDTHYEDYLETLEGKNLPVVHCVKGTKGWELQEDIERFSVERFEKVTFGSLKCADYAAGQGYDFVEVVGLCTDICVISNALLVKAAMPYTPISVDASCCAGVTPESHKNALEAMKMCQIQVVNRQGKDGWEIRKTRPEEIEEVMGIYAHARTFMAEHGNPNQWGNSRPSRNDIERDIESGDSYVCVAEGKIAAVFYYHVGEDPTYAVIEDGQWLNDRPYGVVHRIASDGKTKGAGSFCVNWAVSQCGNLKIDTHRDNVVMQNMLKKNGFQYCGIIYIENGDERLAFQRCDG